MVADFIVCVFPEILWGRQVLAVYKGGISISYRLNGKEQITHKIRIKFHFITPFEVIVPSIFGYFKIKGGENVELWSYLVIGIYIAIVVVYMHVCR